MEIKMTPVWSWPVLLLLSAAVSGSVISRQQQVYGAEQETFKDLGVAEAPRGAHSREADGRWLAFRPHGFNRRFGLASEFARRQGATEPPFGSIVKVYLGGPPADGSDPSSLPGPVLLKRSPNPGMVSYPGLAVATNDPSLESVPPMVIARRRGRPVAGKRARRPFGKRPDFRRRQGWAVYPPPAAAVEKRGSIAPPGHWEGMDPFLAWQAVAGRADREAANSSGKTRAKLNSNRNKATPLSASQKSNKPPKGSFQPKLTTNRFPSRSKTLKPTKPIVLSRKASRPSSPSHKSVDLTASVVYPGSSRASQARHTVAKDGVIVAVGADPEEAAHKMAAGRGFKLRPQTVQYGGWKPISA